MTFTSTIMLNNRAIEMATIMGDYESSHTMLRECFLSAKQSLVSFDTRKHARHSKKVTRSNEANNEEYTSSVDQCISGRIRRESASRLVPSFNMLPSNDSALSAELYTFRQPFYITPDLATEEDEEDDLECETAVLCSGQLVSAAILFNMALLYHLIPPSTTATSGSPPFGNLAPSTLHGTRRRSRLVKARQIYHLVITLARQIQDFFPSTVTDLCIVTYNNLFQLELELDDMDKAREALSSLHHTTAMRQEMEAAMAASSSSSSSAASAASSAAGEPTWFLVGSNEIVWQEILLNAIVINVSTTTHCQTSSSSSSSSSPCRCNTPECNNNNLCFVLSRCAPAA